MSYAPPTVNSFGIDIPEYQDIIEYLVEGCKRIYGEDIYLESDSQDYQLLSTFALLMYDVCQSLVLSYNSASIDTAIGAALDRLASLLGIQRKQGVASTALLTCKGVAGTIVSYGSARDVNGNIWQMETEFEIGKNGEVDVFASCLTDGAIQAAIGTINQIVTPTAGWESVTNKYAASIGTDIETDAHLRARLKNASSLTSRTVFEGNIVGLESLDDVLRVTGYENPTGEIDDKGIPPHSIALIVQGGNDEEIAQEIYKRKTPGTGTYGSTTVFVETMTGQQMPIQFSRPEYKNVYVKINISTLDGYIDSIDEQIKQNIISEFQNLNIAQHLYSSDLYYAVLGAMPNVNTPSFFVTSISVGETSSQNLNVIKTGAFQLLSTDKSLITINKTRG